MRVIFILLLITLAVATPIRYKSFSKYHSINYDRYWSYAEIVDWMQHIKKKYPEITEIFQFGRTEGGVDIMGIRVTNEEHLAQKELPIVFITAATSAKDWITAMSAVNVIYMLAEYRNFHGEIVDDIDWYILPVANPDGYNFSMTEGNHDWVKNRRVNLESDCLGVNIEREETKTIQFAFSRIQPAYITLKAGNPDSSNGLITYPFSYSNEAMPPNPFEQQEVAWQIRNNVRRMTGARFNTGTYSNMVVPTAGTSMDYAAGADQVPLSYTIFTLPFGRFGWDVEEFRINAIIDQVFFAIESLGRYVLTMAIPEK